eukprot:CAMPEP_0206164742 /NCGR_PEP_ID=MMETSP1474-20131121/17895_1 /ASSEMBLY_ACC=CAM_ASM_001110 /TAXON_ID=97495 /ORGANISM="Imantonia sp., Strain RCC918" /LENGTH=130 /DNA_ID=CAMNT_0053567779 /DNA_START=54 /DNA_END=447 /DNA_ORIENTATION=+
MLLIAMAVEGAAGDVVSPCALGRSLHRPWNARQNKRRLVGLGSGLWLSSAARSEATGIDEIAFSAREVAGATRALWIPCTTRDDLTQLLVQPENVRQAGRLIVAVDGRLLRRVGKLEGGSKSKLSALRAD